MGKNKAAYERLRLQRLQDIYFCEDRIGTSVDRDKLGEFKSLAWTFENCCGMYCAKPKTEAAQQWQKK